MPQQWKPLKISKVAKVGEFLLLLKFPSLRKKKKVNILVGITEPAEWKRFNSKELGISSSMIAKPAKIVLNGLRSKGTLFHS